MSKQELIQAMTSGYTHKTRQFIEKIESELLKAKMVHTQNPYNNNALTSTPEEPILLTPIRLGQTKIVKLLINKNSGLIDELKGKKDLVLVPPMKEGNLNLFKFLMTVLPEEIIEMEAISAFKCGLEAKSTKLLEILILTPCSRNIIKDNVSIFNKLGEAGMYTLIGDLPPKISLELLSNKTQNDPFLIETFNKCKIALDLEISQIPNKAINYLRKANVLYTLSKKEKALNYYKKAIELDGDIKDKITIDLIEYPSFLRSLKMGPEYVKQTYEECSNNLLSVKKEIEKINFNMECLQRTFTQEMNYNNINFIENKIELGGDINLSNTEN